MSDKHRFNDLLIDLEREYSRRRYEIEYYYKKRFNDLNLWYDHEKDLLHIKAVKEGFIKDDENLEIVLGRERSISDE
jgi:hypothetical protein